MCTSFVLYSDKTYIGMNFDISDRPIALSLKNNGQFLVSQKDGATFYPAFGLNQSGAFMNLLMVDPNEAGKYRRGKDCVHIIKIFEGVLSGQIGGNSLETLFWEKTIVNVPNLSVHSLVTGANRSAWVIEPGRGNIQFNPLERTFLVLTNFPLSDFIDQDYTAVTGAGADRYQTCYRMLLESDQPFRVNRGFSILAATAQSAGDFPTQFSMLAVPEDERVYFALRQDFQRRFVFSFEDKLIRLEENWEPLLKRPLDHKGVLLSELER